MFMKKYLLAVLALGAMVMTACEPKNGGEDTPPTPEVVADYTLSTDVIEVILENYGDYYMVGLNDYSLSLGAMELDEATGQGTIKMLFMEYLTEPTNKTGLGTFGPAGINWETGEGLAPNVYLDATEIEGEIIGCGYIELDVVTESYKAYEGIKSGDLTVSKDGDNYVIKGLLTTLSGKTLKVDYTGAATFEDYSNIGGAEPLSTKKSFNFGKHFSTAAKFFKK